MQRPVLHPLQKHPVLNPVSSQRRFASVQRIGGDFHNVHDELRPSQDLLLEFPERCQSIYIRQ